MLVTLVSFLETDIPVTYLNNHVERCMSSIRSSRRQELWLELSHATESLQLCVSSVFVVATQEFNHRAGLLNQFIMKVGCPVCSLLANSWFLSLKLLFCAVTRQ